MKKVANITIEDSTFSENYDSCLYILKCYKNKQALRNKEGEFLYYTDITSNPAKRLEEHIKNKDNYTKRFNGNVEVSYVELYNDLAAAQIRKEQVKKLRREEKAHLISRKVSGVCHKCHEKMVKSIIIDQNGERKQILQCTGCKFWKVLPINF